MKITIIIAAILVVLCVAFRNQISPLFSKNHWEQEKNGKKKKAKNANHPAPPSEGISVLKTWELPPELKEISGISFLEDGRFACVQDELGTVFIFDALKGRVDEKVAFTGPGDFEGIAVQGNTAFIIRADGMLFETDMATHQTKEYRTHLTAEQNVEGLCLDKNNNRLLLAIKDNEPGKPGYKGIYAFNLNSKLPEKEPVFKIDLQSGALTGANVKQGKTIMPSDLAINPVTNDIYITDGPGSNLVIMDGSGKIKKSYHLGKEFTQPEGITFDREGGMYISNEGKKGLATIIKLSVNE